jgi:tetratricopeptide (TPR) repeat protein
MKNILRALILTLCLPMYIQAQSGGTYMDGVQLMREAKYEQAYTIFTRLLREDPTNFPVFDQTITALVNLKRYEDAINLTNRRLGQNYTDIILATRLAELYHLNGDFDQAYKTWNRAIEANQQSVNAYRFVADNMAQRREHAKAIEVYTAARQRFNNNTLFFSEITTNFMAVGDRQKAVSTLLDVLDFSPGNSNFVLRQVINFDDAQFTELAIIELDERSRTVSSNQDVVSAQKEVLIGLLMERQFYRRALSSARSYESTSREGNWPVFTLSGRLRALQQFELADEALEFYIRTQNHPLLPRALEERATLYMTWAEHLDEYNLVSETPADTLISRALFSLNRLLNEFPGDNRRIETLSLKAELVLDNYSDIYTANQLVSEIRRLTFNNEHRIIANYLDGRINMTEGQHSLARVNLTRANREARTGELAEKTRYFLALNDFYTGDFEFSSIQMRALERLTTSYYANDALKLRVWIREGMMKDSVTAELRSFSRAKYLFDVNQQNNALTQVLTIFQGSQSKPLTGDFLLMISDNIRHNYPALTYHLIDVLTDKSSPAIRERILWEKARIMELLVTKAPVKNTFNQELESLARAVYSLSSPSTADVDASQLKAWLDSTQFSTSDVITAYENILFDYPTGFYAQLVRQRIESFRNTPS